MINAFIITGLVFALLCLAAWYNQPEPEPQWQYMDYMTTATDGKRYQVTGWWRSSFGIEPVIRTGTLRPSMPLSHFHKGIEPATPYPLRFLGLDGQPCECPLCRGDRAIEEKEKTND